MLVTEKFDGIVDIVRTVASLPDDFVNVARQTIKHLRGSQRAATQVNQELELRWYESLAKGTPDYSVYNDPIYLAELLACFCVYSQKYIREIAKAGFLDDAESVLDLGCGIGLTTAALKEITNARVVGTNIAQTFQYQTALRLSNFYHFFVSPFLPLSMDIVFASEYFEHFENPIEHLEEVICTATPKALFIANTFNAKSIGHFDVYKFRGKNFNGAEISRMFNKRLRELGYEKIKTSFWNQRPAYWKKVAAHCESLF